MPGIDGVKLGQQLTKHVPRTKIVLWSEVEKDDPVLTPQVLDGWRKEGYCFGILPCPLEKEELLGKMKRWVADSVRR